MLLSRQCSPWRQACTRGHHSDPIYGSVSAARHPAALQAPRYKCSVAVKTSRSSRSATICQAAGANVSSAAATSTILYVSQLDPSIKGDELTSHFKGQAGFDSAFVMNVADEDGQQEYLGYVQFSNPQAAAAAQKALDGSQLRQKRIKVRAQRGGSTDESDEQSTDAAEPSGPATPQHTAATTAGSEAASSSATAADGSADDEAGSGAKGSPGMSRSKKHRLRQNAKKEGIPAPAPNVLFVPNMRQETTEEQLIECFREQPGYQSAQLRKPWNRRCDGYVTFDSESTAAAAMEALQGTSLNRLPLKIFIHEKLSRERKAELAAANSAKSQKPPKGKPAAAAAAAAAAEGVDSSTKNNDSSPDSSSGGGAKGRRKSMLPRPRVTYSVKVLNLAWSTDAEGLSAHFGDCPGFVDASTLLEEGGRASGIGYVRFATPEAAKAAIEAKDQTELDGRSIKVFVSQKESVKFEAAAAAAAASSSGKSRRRRGGKKAWAIQVSSLAWETTDEDLVEHFKDCQGYTGAFIVTGKDNRPSGIGYVTFESNEAQLKAIEAKQGSELVGRSIQLTLTRTGRVESSTAADEPAAGAAGSAGSTDAALEKTDIVLMGLPPSFTYKEVSGLCSYFGEVKSVVRMKKGSYKPSKDSNSSAGDDSAAAATAYAEAGQVAAKDVADSSRQGQPCFVIMGTARAAAAAVGALNGRTVQGCVLKAALATPKKAPKKRKSTKATKQEGKAADGQAGESKADASSS